MCYVKIFWCNILVGNQKIPHQLSLVVKLSLEKLSVYGQLRRMCYMLLELETLLVVQSHTKNKIGNSFKLRVTLIEYSFDEIYIYCFENRLILKPPKIYRSSRTGVFLGTGVLVICSKFTGEHPCRSAISIKLGKFTGEQPCRRTMPCNFIEIALRHGCSPVNFCIFSEHLFLRTPLDGCF